MQYWWTDTDRAKPKYSFKKNLYPCHFVRAPSSSSSACCSLQKDKRVKTGKRPKRSTRSVNRGTRIVFSLFCNYPELAGDCFITTLSPAVTWKMKHSLQDISAVNCVLAYLIFRYILKLLGQIVYFAARFMLFLCRP